MNALAKKTLEALRKTDNNFLNYIAVPMPDNDVFDALSSRIKLADDFVLKMDDSFTKHRDRLLAHEQTTLVLTAIEKITGNSIASTSHAYIKPSLLTKDGFSFAAAEVLASIDVSALPTVAEADAYHAGYNLKARLIQTIDIWHTVEERRNRLWVADDINKPFIEWHRHIISIYLWLLIACEKSEGEMIDGDGLTEILGNDLTKSMQHKIT